MLIKNRAGGVGIATWRGRSLPTDKAAYIAELAEDSRKVLMDWEGLNDAPVLIQGNAIRPLAWRQLFPP